MRRWKWSGVTLLVLVGMFSAVVWASTSQSLHFPVPAPAVVGNVSVNLKANGFGPIKSGDIPIAALDPAATVTMKAGQGLCLAITSTLGFIPFPALPSAARPGCGGSEGLVNCATTAADCCDAGAGVALTLQCVSASGEDFTLSRGVGAVNFQVGTGTGNVSNLNVDNKNYYPDVRADLAAQVNVQARANGIATTIQGRVFHTQGGANPRTFSIANPNTLTSQQLAQAIASGFSGLLSAPALTTVVHAPADNEFPLTWFPETFIQGYWVTITNAQAAGVTDVELIGGTGQGLVIEPTENIVDSPALGSWGILAVVTLLLLSGYWLMRRRQGAVTAP